MLDTNTRGRRGRPRCLTAADEAKILGLLKRKVPIARVAEDFGVHPKTVSRYLRDRGLRPQKLDAAAVANEYATGGETYARMAARRDTSPSTIGRKVRAYGRPAKRGRPGASDPRCGHGQRRGWKGEDYARDSLGQRGREAWASWLAAMGDKKLARTKAALTGLNTPLHDALHGSRAAARVRIRDDQQLDLLLIAEDA